MKITYDIIKKNIETYNKAKEIFPAISQFEDKKIDFTAMRGLGLGKFADFYMFMETVNNNGYTPIINTKSSRVLKPMIIEKTSTERFKTYIKNRTQSKFDLILNDNDLFDRLLNGAWKSRPKMRRNGQMGYGTRKNERVEGFKDAIVPIINYIILNEIEINYNIPNQSKIENVIKWYTTEELNYDSVPQREIELTNKLLQTFLDVVDNEKIDFRKLNIKYILSAISNKIKNAMDIKNGTMLKCIKELEDPNYTGRILLKKGNTYEVTGTYERNGYLIVYVENELGHKQYYEYSYFDDMSIRRDDLLSMLLD